MSLNNKKIYKDFKYDSLNNDNEDNNEDNNEETEQQKFEQMSKDAIHCIYIGGTKRKNPIKINTDAYTITDLYEGDPNSYDMGKHYNQQYMQIQQSLQQFGTYLDYLWYSNIHRGKNFIMKSQDERFIWQANTKGMSSFNVLFVDNRKIKMSEWLAINSKKQKKFVDNV